MPHWLMPIKQQRAILQSPSSPALLLFLRGWPWGRRDLRPLRDGLERGAQAPLPRCFQSHILREPRQMRELLRLIHCILSRSPSMAAYGQKGDAESYCLCGRGMMHMLTALMEPMRMHT
jgi:hypothetical protein